MKISSALLALLCLVLSALAAEPEITPQTQARAALEKDYDAAFAAAEQMKFDAPALRAKLDAFLAQYPDDADAASFVGNYFYYVEAVDLKLAMAEWQSFANHSHPKIKALAEKKAGLAALIKTPVELKFTAADGRAVDVAALRGKVVLIDFWATWCGPCRAVMPALDAMYTEFHTQGLEVMGVTHFYPNGYMAKDKSQMRSGGESVQGLTEATFAAHVTEFRTNTGIHYPFVIADKADFKNYKVSGIPTLAVVGKDGNIALITVGAGSEGMLRFAVKSLLKAE